MKDYRPLDETEQTAVAEVCRVLRPKGLILHRLQRQSPRVHRLRKMRDRLPQHLPIRQYLKDAAKEFEKK